MLSRPRHQALRTVWLSDVHLGSRECRVNLLLDFLRHTRCDVLYLVGDIVDLENLRKSFYWPASHTEVLRLLLKKSQEGTRIVYIPGNHDDDLRALAGVKFGNIEIASHAIHTTRDGPPAARRARRSVRRRRAPAGRSAFGSAASRAGACSTLNRFVHWLHDVFDRPYWSLAQHVKARFPGAQALHRPLPRRDARRRARSRRRRRRLRAHPSRRVSPRSTASSTATTATGSRAARRSSRTRRGELVAARVAADGRDDRGAGRVGFGLGRDDRRRRAGSRLRPGTA